jgi:hypothetical protein
MKRTSRTGFTLVEGLIAAALGIIICGGGIYIYMQGNKMFQTTTEHSSIREEALLVLEKINKDLDALMVSDEEDPETKSYYLLKPYTLTGPVEQKYTDKRTGEQKTYTEYTGIQFYVYHHTETTPDETNGFPLPMLVGQMIEYRCDPINGDPKKGFNLMRNGVKVNKQPLSAVFFRKADPIYAKGNIGASPDAVLDVYVMPKGGMWGTMTPDVMARLVQEGHALMRTFHLVGYESQFTALLSLADAKRRYGETLDPVETAIWAYAKQEGLLANVASKTADTPLEYRLPRGRVKLEKVLFNPATAGDKEFASAKTEPGDQEQGNVGPGSINLSAGSRSSRLSL